MPRDLGVSSALQPGVVAPRRRVASGALLEGRLRPNLRVSLKAASGRPELPRLRLVIRRGSTALADVGTCSRPPPGARLDPLVPSPPHSPPPAAQAR